MTFQQIFEKVDEVTGWLGEGACQVLYEYAKGIKKGTILEIGCYMGRSTLLLALSSPTSQITSIDPYISLDNSFGEVKPTEAKANCERTMEDQKWNLIGTTSTDAAKIWTKKIDLLFIDGDHSYEQVKQDIEMFAPYVKKGHYMILDDYAVIQYGVRKAIDEIWSKYFDSREIKEGLAVCRKK